MNKSFRQGQILKLIRRQRVRTQEELARELGALGIQTTQVTLSRDIRDLGLVKTAAGYDEGAREGGPDLATVTAEYVETTFRVSERKYGAWPAAIREGFEAARTVRPGKATFRLQLAEAR